MTYIKYYYLYVLLEIFRIIQWYLLYQSIPDSEHIQTKTHLSYILLFEPCCKIGSQFKANLSLVP